MYPSCRGGAASVSGGLLLLLLWFGMCSGWGLLGRILLGCTVHELGHCLVLHVLGGHVQSLRLTVLGAQIRADCSRLSYGREALAVLAGPAVNLISAGGLALLAGRLQAPALYLDAGIHLLLGGWNLLPIRSLDGRRALELLMSGSRGPDAGGRIRALSGALCAGGLGGLLILAMLRQGGSLWLAPAAAALGRAAFSDLRAACIFREEGRPHGA